MKRIIAVFFSLLIVILALTVPAFAGYDGWNSYDTYTSYPIFRSIYFSQGFNSGTDFMKQGGAIDLSYLVYDPAIPEIVYSNDVDVVLNGSTSTPEAYSEYSYSLNYNNSDNKFYVTLPFTAFKDYQIDDHNFITDLELVRSDDTLFCTFSDLGSYVFIDPSVNFEDGYGTTSQQHSCMLSYVVTVSSASGGASYQMRQHYFSGSSKSELVTSIQEFKRAQAEEYISIFDIVGISNYKIRLTTNLQGGGATSGNADADLNGDVRFSVSNNTNVLRTSYDFLEQTPTGNRLGYQMAGDVIYESDLNISSVFTAVKDALSVDIIGVLSFMDLLTIVVGIAIAIWILKVFAGG